MKKKQFLADRARKNYHKRKDEGRLITNKIPIEEQKKRGRKKLSEMENPPPKPPPKIKIKPEPKPRGRKLKEIDDISNIPEYITKLMKLSKNSMKVLLNEADSDAEPYEEYLQRIEKLN